MPLNPNGLEINYISKNADTLNAFVTTLGSGPFVGAQHWGVGDVITIKNNTSLTTGNITFTETYQDDNADGGITVFSVPSATIPIPSPGSTTTLTFTDRGFGTYVYATFSRNKRQRVVVQASVSGSSVTASYEVFVSPKVYQDTVSRQNGYTGEVKIYEYWQKVQPVNDITKPLILNNSGEVPLLVSSKDTIPTDATQVGVRLLPGETRILTPLAAGYYYWARTDYPQGSTLDCSGEASFIQAG